MISQKGINDITEGRVAARLNYCRNDRICFFHSFSSPLLIFSSLSLNEFINFIICYLISITFDYIALMHQGKVWKIIMTIRRPYFDSG